MAPRPSQRKSTFAYLLRQSPALFRKSIFGASSTLLIVALFFGIDFLDWIFVQQDGVSALTPLRHWLNESTGIKLLLLLFWGWAVMDLAFFGGEIIATGPYERYARHLDGVPGHFAPFHLREGDQHFRRLSDAYNGMVVRLTHQEEQLQKLLQRAVEKKYSAERIRDEVQQYIGDRNEPEGRI